MVPKGTKAKSEDVQQIVDYFTGMGSAANIGPAYAEQAVRLQESMMRTSSLYRYADSFKLPPPQSELENVKKNLHTAFRDAVAYLPDEYRQRCSTVATMAEMVGVIREYERVLVQEETMTRA